MNWRLTLNGVTISNQSIGTVPLTNGTILQFANLISGPGVLALVPVSPGILQQASLQVQILY
jgi:hypothetical protein